MKRRRVNQLLRVRPTQLLALAGVWTLVACDTDAPVATVSEEATFMGADGIVMVGTTTITNDRGIRTALLQFDTAFQWSDSIHQSLRGVDLTVFNEMDGSQRARVTALRGTFNPRDQSLTAYGDVVLTIPFQNRELETEELHYDPIEELLRSDSAVVVRENNRTYEGTSFSSDLEFGSFQVYGVGGR